MPSPAATSTIGADKATTGIWRPLLEAAEPRIRIVFLSGDPGTPGHRSASNDVRPPLRPPVRRRSSCASTSSMLICTPCRPPTSSSYGGHSGTICWHGSSRRRMRSAERSSTISTTSCSTRGSPRRASSTESGASVWTSAYRRPSLRYSNILTAFANSDFGVAPTDFFPRTACVRTRSRFRPFPTDSTTGTSAAARAAVRARSIRPADGVERIGDAGRHADASA